MQKAGFAAEAIHGNKSQNQRERVLADFRNGKLRTLIATDIAARGIDVDGVSHVFNYDLPNIPESYVHRIGRTARAGAEGVAISFCDHEERAFLRDIERLIRMTIPATDRRTGTAGSPSGPASRRQPANGGRPQRGNASSVTAAATAVTTAATMARRNGGKGQQGRPRARTANQPATHRPPGTRPRRGSQTASEMLHSCSARTGRAATRPSRA